MINGRNIPLDILRGLVIFAMIFVDAPPDFENLYSILAHSPWEGATIADTVFPGFVFVMGAAFAFSEKNKKRLRTKIWLKKISKRTAILFSLGIVFNAFPLILNYVLTKPMDFLSVAYELFDHIRIMGVLQRLALVYFFAALIIRFLKEKHLLTAAFGLLLVSSVLTHIYSPDAPFDRVNNLHIYIDLLVLGENHILFQNPPYEPEGIFGTLASVSTMLFGFYAAKLISQKKYRGLVFLGSLAIFAGGVWSVFDIISKPLWTAPYALLMTGLFIFLFLAAQFLHDKSGGKKDIFIPFIAFGRRPIFFYLATNFALILLNSVYLLNGNSIYVSIYNASVKGLVSDAFSSALFAFLWCLLWVPIAMFMYVKR